MLSPPAAICAGASTAAHHLPHGWTKSKPNMSFPIQAETPVLELEALTKRYGRKEAVSAVSFTVRQAELVGLLGSNGAGKSSTLRMIAGSLAPSNGYVRICGCDTAEQPAEAKSFIGYLPEVPPLYPEMTVREYLDFACDLKNAAAKNSNPDNTAWFKSITSDLEIEDHMSVLIRNLSKGYKQRVGIAAAIACKPALLLLDEPVSGLDPRQVAEFRSMLRSICSHMAVIISSHGLLEIASLCTRVIIMNEGRIVADTSMETLRSSETNLEDLFISLTKP